MEAYNETKKKNAREKPMVISVKNSTKGTTLVLAVLGYARSESTKK